MLYLLFNGLRSIFVSRVVTMKHKRWNKYLIDSYVLSLLSTKLGNRDFEFLFSNMMVKRSPAVFTCSFCVIKLIVFYCAS